MREMKCVLTIVAIATTVVGCVTASQTPVDTTGGVDAEELQKRWVLGEGDLVEIKVFREPDLTVTQRVAREDMEFPLIGRIALLGRDAKSVGDEITLRLVEGKFLVNPQVSVFIKEHNSRKVHVMGFVNKPGSFLYESGMTVIQAISNAGGFGKMAAKNDVEITRVVDGDRKKFKVRAGDIAKGLEANFILEPGDIVWVNESPF